MTSVAALIIVKVSYKKTYLNLNRRHIEKQIREVLDWQK